MPGTNVRSATSAVPSASACAVRAQYVRSTEAQGYSAGACVRTHAEWMVVRYVPRVLANEAEGVELVWLWPKFRVAVQKPVRSVGDEEQLMVRRGEL